MGISDDKTVIRAISWSNAIIKEEVRQFDVSSNKASKSVNGVYIGIRSVVFDTNVDGIGLRARQWKDLENCYSSEYCLKCKDAATSALITALLATISKVPLLKVLHSRRLVAKDNDVLKFNSIIGCTISFITTALSLASYDFDCHESLPGEIVFDTGRGMTTLITKWSLGPGFICMLLSLVNQGILFVIFVLTATPKKDFVDIMDY
eukprot:CAMPEP_0196575716 /NCGR_PEP_ID=MMETSP1081-20130531/5141_1 /TAXON_ID=36882 /ORGANISM="Pyramimonas amylifera, Strain CCMP720" /LENGTH=205 /DNA_ID=CAMNT_0041894103 /DNA_START=152 /DNA_END=769 /DNA_ORIENTATION=+